jgi:ubiquinone/menaquinone biosynthesis C-methylase UbiE
MTTAKLPERYDVTPANIDGAMRYWMVIDQLRDVYRPDLELLEVGSGSGGVTEFLDHPVTGVDTAFERTAERATRWLTPVEASATALPFEDESFDAVLSCEMVEHLPAGDRTKALTEMFRVLRPGGRMVVTFPADEAARKLDSWLNRAYNKRHRKDHPWAVEHLREGVPRTEDVARVVDGIVGDAGTWRIRKHAWAPAWKLQMMLFSVERGYPWTRAAGIYTVPTAKVLFRTLRHLNRGECYRTVVIVSKR